MSVEKHHGIVRDALQLAGSFVWGMYGQAEKYPMVKSTLELYKPFIPIVQPVMEKVVASADPWVEKVDDVVAETWKTVNYRIIDPSRNLSGVYARVKKSAVLELHNRYTALLDLTDQAVDTYLPEENASEEYSKVEKNEEEKHVKTVAQVSTKAQKRVLKKMENKWQDVKAFSATRLKEIIHIDLVAYAESGVSACIEFAEDPYENTKNVTFGLVGAAQALVVTVKNISAERAQLIAQAIGKYRELAEENVVKAYEFATLKAKESGVDNVVEKAQKVSLNEMSEYVLTKLHFKQESADFVLVEQKIVEVFTTLMGLILKRGGKKQAEGASAN